MEISVMKNHDSTLPISNEGLYPIRTVSEISGVNTITLRAWERRYGLVNPQRTEKGHRLYSDQDIQRVKDVLALLDKGISIGQAAKVINSSSAQIDTATPDYFRKNSSDINHNSQLHDASPLTEKDWLNHQKKLLHIIGQYDYTQLESFHRQLFSEQKVRPIFEYLIEPVLDKLKPAGDDTSAYSAEYDFYKTFIHQNVLSLCPKLSAEHKDKLLVVGLKDKHCEFELLLFVLPFLQNGMDLIILGCNVPVKSIPNVLEDSKANGLLLFTEIDKNDVQNTEALMTMLDEIEQPVFVSQQNATGIRHQLNEMGCINLAHNNHDNVTLIKKNILKKGK